MARKKSSSLPKKLLPIAAAFLVLVALGFVFLGSKDQSTHRTVPALDVAAYLENSNSLRGNTYKLEGKVSESLAWSPDSGRLIAIEVDNEILRPRHRRFQRHEHPKGAAPRVSRGR